MGMQRVAWPRPQSKGATNTRFSDALLLIFCCADIKCYYIPGKELFYRKKFMQKLIKLSSLLLIATVLFATGCSSTKKSTCGCVGMVGYK